MPTIKIFAATGLKRIQAMEFIRRHFSEHFGAAVDDDTEEVYVVESSSGIIEAAFGLNRQPASFFCKRYLSEDLELAVFGQQQDKQSPALVELAHLCVNRPSTLCRIMGELASFLASQGDQLICTVTRQLARYFKRAGLAPRIVAHARAEHLSKADQVRWGSYYLQQPMVITGNLLTAQARLSELPRRTAGASYAR